MKTAWGYLVRAPLVVLATVAMGTLSVALSFVDREGRLTDHIAKWWAGMLLAIGGVDVRIWGLEHIQGPGPYVFAGNHQSLMDTPVVLARVPLRFLFLVNSKYVKIPFLGTHLRRTGHFSVDPEDVRASLRAMTEAANAVRSRGISILLFPEGSRAKGAMEEFKEGAAYIAIKAGIPILPFGLRGTRRVLPVGSLCLRGGPVDLVFGEPIPTDGYRLKDRAELTSLLFRRVAELAGASGSGDAADTLSRKQTVP